MLAALPVAVVAYAAGVVAARAAAGRGGVGIGVVAAVCAVPWCLFAAYYLHVVDVVAYFEWRSRAATDLLAGLVGVSVGVVRVRIAGTRRGPWDVVGLAIVGGLWLAAFAKPLLRLLPASEIRERVVDGVCLQSTPSTCGPCAAATVLRQLGHEVGEGALAQEASSTTSGTLNWLLVRAVRERGFAAHFSAPESVVDVTPPAIIGVRIGSIGHFVALLAVAGDTVVIGEPLTGLRRMRLADFQRSYTFDHLAIEVSR